MGDPIIDASNVISIYSDAYSNVSGTDLNPNWGQATVVTDEIINGNNVLKAKTISFGQTLVKLHLYAKMLC